MKNWIVIEDDGGIKSPMKTEALEEEGRKEASFLTNSKTGNRNIFLTDAAPTSIQDRKKLTWLLRPRLSSLARCDWFAVLSRAKA